MNKLLTLIIISFSITSCKTLQNTNPPYIGTWEVNIDGCIETWIIEKNGMRRTKSAEEETVNKYTVTEVEEGTYEVIDTRISSNSKKDCSGKRTNTANGHVSRNKIKFLDKDTFILCYPERCLDEYPFTRKK